MTKKFILLIFGFLFGIIAVINPLPVDAQANVPTTTPAACKSAIAKKQIRIWDLPKINEFLPLIPSVCSDNGGEIVALGVSALPDILLRAVGLLFSLSFYIMPGAFVLLGLNLALKPFDPAINKNQFQEITTIGRLITKQLGNILIGLVLILFSYTIVFTILKLFDFQGDYTDLSAFFV